MSNLTMQDYIETCNLIQSKLRFKHDNGELLFCKCRDIESDDGGWTFAEYKIDNDNQYKEMEEFLTTMNAVIYASAYPGKILLPKRGKTHGVLYLYEEDTISVYESALIESSKNTNPKLLFLDINKDKNKSIKYLKQKHSKYTKYIDNYNGEIVIDTDKDIIVGQVFVGKTGKDVGFITGLWVRDSYRNTGIGKRLLNDAVRKYHGTDLTVDKDNNVAINMYKKYGFVNIKWNSDSQNWMKLKSKLSADDILAESSKDNQSEIPDEIKDLLKTLNSYDYGYLVNGKPATDMERFFENYKSLTIKEFEKYKIGVCWDYVHYEADWFKNHGYKYETFYVQVQDEDGDCPSHTYLVFYLPGSNTPYYFESSWGAYQGIEKFKNITELHNTIKKRHIEAAQSKCYPNTYFREKYDAVSKSWENLSCGEYMVKISKGRIKLDEACKDLKAARQFIRDVDKLAKKYDANYFIVTDGASGTSNKGNQYTDFISLTTTTGYIPAEFIEKIPTPNTIEDVKKLEGVIQENTIYESSNSAYFISQTNMDSHILYPKVPNNYFTKNGYEDNKTERVCFAPSIDQCLMGLSYNCSGKEFYVHIPSDRINLYHPTIKDVPDCKITGELWSKEQVKLKCIGKIKVVKDKGTPGKQFSYGNKTAELYEWDWKWIERNNTNESTDEGYFPNTWYMDSIIAPYKIYPYEFIVTDESEAMLPPIHSNIPYSMEDFEPVAGKIKIPHQESLEEGVLDNKTIKDTDFTKELDSEVKNIVSFCNGSDRMIDTIRSRIDYSIKSNRNNAWLTKDSYFTNNPDHIPLMKYNLVVKNQNDKELSLQRKYWVYGKHTDDVEIGLQTAIEHDVIPELKKNINKNKVLSEFNNISSIKCISDNKNKTGLYIIVKFKKPIIWSKKKYLGESTDEDIFYGLPELKKYPMPDEKHVLSAIKFFNYVSPENEKELAKNIKKKMREYNISYSRVGEKNRLKKYLNEAAILTELCFEDFNHTKPILVFDLGSVLVEEKYPFEEALRRSPLVPNDLAGTISRFIIDTFKSNPSYLDSCSTDDYYKYMTDKAPKEIKKYIPTALKIDIDNIIKLPYTDKLLKALTDKGYELYYISNWSRWSRDALVKNKTFDFLGYFVNGVFSCDMKCSKPDHKIFDKFFNLFKLDNKHTMFFDDNYDNIRAANEIGMNGVLFDKNYTEEWIRNNLL